MILGSSVFIFRIYLIIAIIFLLFLCSFMTLELIKSCIYYYIYFVKFYGIDHKNFNIDNIIFLFQYKLKKKQWFSCILMIEFFQEVQDINYSNFLGICYQKLSLDFVAEYYYLQVLNYDSKNLVILHNLAEIYCKIDKKEEALKIYNRIISIDSNDKIAMKILMNS